MLANNDSMLVCMGQDLASIPNTTEKEKKVGREGERRKDKRPEKKIVSRELGLGEGALLY